MLQGDFYIIKSVVTQEAAIKATIEFNAAHDIFKGHFPETPVVPGVCMMQLVKENLENTLGKKLNLAKADHMKFLTVISPTHTKEVYLDLKYSFAENKDIIAIASLYNEGVVYFKFKGTFK
jgi:3-hydroxyacyl-[acyl-carrier-protein] dehydratase